MNTPAERLAWARSFCKKIQLRLTPARERVLACLASCRTPVKVDTITQSDGIRGHFNKTTVYRAVKLLNELEVIHQVNVRQNVGCFVLNVPGEPCAYLICRCCGSVAPLPELESVLDLQRRVSAARGYSAVYHELDVFGICPDCQATRKWSRPAAKLPVRT